MKMLASGLFLLAVGAHAQWKHDANGKPLWPRYEVTTQHSVSLELTVLQGGQTYWDAGSDNSCVVIPDSAGTITGSFPLKYRIFCNLPSENSGIERSQDPVDVAPIEVPLGNCVINLCMTLSTPAVGVTKLTKSTCADKSRFLMTAEDGTKHCIKLN